MTIAKLNKCIHCSVCDESPNSGKYFPENIILVLVRKETYDEVQQGKLAVIGEIIFWRPQWKVYPFNNLEWGWPLFRELIALKKGVENFWIGYSEWINEDDFFAIICTNCFCDKCDRLTTYAEYYVDGRIPSYRYCENKCKPFWEFWPKEEKKKFSKALSRINKS